MYLGRVIGCVWATVKHPGFEGQRMLLVQPLQPDLQSTGKQCICLDATGAGSGEIVYFVKGKEASFPFLPAEPPIDSTVVGIVDSIHLQPAKQSQAAPGGTRNPTHKKGKRC